MRYDCKISNQEYDDDPTYKGMYIIAMLVINQYEDGMDIKKAIQNYFVYPDNVSVDKIMKIVRER